MIFRGIVPTEAGTLVEFFRGLGGAVQVAFEEGTQAPNILAPEEIRSDRQGHTARGIGQGNVCS